MSWNPRREAHTEQNPEIERNIEIATRMLTDDRLKFSQQECIDALVDMGVPDYAAFHAVVAAQLLLV